MDIADRVIHKLGGEAAMPGDPDRKIRCAAAAAGALRRPDGDARIRAVGRAARAACRHPDAADLEKRRLAAARAAAAVPLTKAHAPPVLPDTGALDRLLLELRRKPEPARPAPVRRAPPTPRPAVAPSQPARAAPSPAIPASPREPGPLAFWDFRDCVAADIRRGRVQPNPARIVEHAVEKYGANVADAAEWCERFMRSLHRDLRRRRR